MVTLEKKMTAEDFDRWVTRPENVDRDCEFIGGEIVEVVSNNYSSKITGLIIGYLVLFVTPRQLGDVTVTNGGYMVNSERYMPDVAYISRVRQPTPSHDAYNPNAPDLAVEVLSPSNSGSQMRVKITNYLLAGTTVWVVDPELKQIEIYVPGQTPRILGVEDTLDGGSILPGFQLRVSDLFPD
jgi:Uma2 family endonuclease